MGEDVPNRDEDFASDSDDSLLVADAGFEAIEFGFPVGVELDGGPGNFDGSGAEFGRVPIECG